MTLHCCKQVVMIMRNISIYSPSHLWTIKETSGLHSWQGWSRRWAFYQASNKREATHGDFPYAEGRFLSIRQPAGQWHGRYRGYRGRLSRTYAETYIYYILRWCEQNCVTALLFTLSFTTIWLDIRPMVLKPFYHIFGSCSPAKGMVYELSETDRVSMVCSVLCHMLQPCSFSLSKTNT